MRGGQIYIQGNAGYRAGIHMKAYKEKVPLIIIGGKTGSFLGEYQAGGDIIVLGLDSTDRDKSKPAVGGFPCTGMHGGRMFIRGNCDGITFPEQVTVRRASHDDLEGIEKHISEFCRLFDLDAAGIMNSDFTLITPDTKNPYKQMYVLN
jgi:glutamate synthase domain-containing protein 3